MSSSPSSVQLGVLDTFRPAKLDADVWQRNIAALRMWNGPLADELDRLELPPHWQPALGLDDTPTYRIELADQPPAWLGHTAAPRSRASGLLRNYKVTGKNLVLLSIGTGHELHTLFQLVPARTIVFVFEEDPRHVAAALRLVDLSPVLECGRCILLPATDEAAYLRQFLRDHPGAVAPATIVLPNLAPPARTTALQPIIEQVYREIETERSAAIEQRLRDLATPQEDDQPRVAIAALSPVNATHAAGRELLAAAEQLGWPSAICMSTDAYDTHPAAHARTLADLAPTLTICVAHERRMLPFQPSGTVCIWHHYESAVPAQLPADDTVHLAATPRVLAALQRAGGNAARVHPFYWAAASPVAKEDRPVDDHRVCVVGDVPDPTPELYGIKQVTLKRLWARLREVVQRNWQTSAIRDTKTLLHRAAAELDLPLRDPSVRERFLELIENIIVPGVISEAVAQALVADGLTVETLGYGWSHGNVDGAQFLGSEWHDLSPKALERRPRACVVAGLTDPLHRAMPLAAAHAWPLLICHVGGKEPPGLTELLSVGTHYGAYNNLVALRQALELANEKRAARRAQRAAEARVHMAAHHTYTARLESLVQQIRG